MKKDPKLGLFSYLAFIFIEILPMQIYLARDNQQAGPYTVEQLNQMLASQQVLLTDLIWHEGMTEWKTVGEMSEGKYTYYPTGYQTAPVFNPQPSPQPSTQNINLIKNNNGANTNTTPELASIGKRALAKIIDLCLWIPASLILSAFLTNQQRLEISELQTKVMQHISQDQIEMAEKLSQQVLHLIPSTTWMMFFAYIILMLIGQAYLLHKTGQTVGKKVMNLQIVDSVSQQKVGITRSFLIRTLATILLIYILPLYALIDYAFGLGKKRQTLHDLMAKTTVIDKK